MSSKSSNATPEVFVFDVPITPEDVTALQRARTTGVPSFADYIRMLSTRPHANPERLAQRPLPIGYAPFSLD